MGDSMPGNRTMQNSADTKITAESEKTSQYMPNESEKNPAENMTNKTAEAPKQTVIRVRDLYKIYRVGTNRVHALNGVSFSISRGEFVAIVGTSGSGKSTLLNMLAGLEPPTKGNIEIAGKRIDRMNERELVAFRRDNVGFIFQSYNLLNTMNGEENVAMPLMFRGVSRQARLLEARKYMKLMSVLDQAKHMPNQMSGGQQQRIGIARAMVVNPRIIFADEPTGNLDSHTTEDVLHLMQRLVREQGKTLVMVTHDNHLASYADKRIRIVDGRIVNVEYGAQSGNVIAELEAGLSKEKQEKAEEALLLEMAGREVLEDGEGIEASILRKAPEKRRLRGRKYMNIGGKAGKAGMGCVMQDLLFRVKMLRAGFLWLLVFSLTASGLLQLDRGIQSAQAAYNDTNLNTFVHNGDSIPEGEAGMPLTIRFRFGYDGVQGLYNPQKDAIRDVNVRLSNDQTYMGVQVEVGENKSAFMKKLEELLGDDFDSARASEYYQGYLDGYNDTNKGTMLYQYPIDSGSYPFEVDSNLFKQKVHIDTLRKGEYKDVSLQVTVRKDTKEGYYAIPVQFDYKLPDVAYVGNRNVPTHVEYINVYIRPAAADDASKVQSEAQFAVGENQSTPFGAYPSVMEFGVNFRNKKEKVYDVTVHLNTTLGKESEMQKTALAKSFATTGFPFDINESNYDRHFDEIDMGQTVNVPYSMAISSHAASGFYPLSYTVTFRKIKNGTLYQETAQSFVRIKNANMEEEETDKSDGEWNENTATKARLIIGSYTTTPEKIYAGDSFELVLELKNASESIGASNILLTFESEQTEDKSAIFATESGANSVVVNSLGAGQAAQVRMTYTARASVPQGSYKITIKEKYDSPDFKNAEESVSVDIPVYQYARLSTSSFEVMPQSVEVGSESNVMFTINNTGKVTLYNVSVTFSADSIKENNTYIGNIKPGTSGSVDAMLAGAAPTQDEGKVKAKISYEDENGNVSTEEKEFDLMVTEPAAEEMTPDMMGDGAEGMDNTGSNSPLDWIKNHIAAVLIAAAILVILVFGLLWRRHLRKKREKALLAEDADLLDTQDTQNTQQKK